MTLAMKLMHEQLPGHERYPLPPRRNALVIAAHVVWGAAAGILVDKLSDDAGEESAARTRRLPAFPVGASRSEAG